MIHPIAKQLWVYTEAVRLASEISTSVLRILNCGYLKYGNNSINECLKLDKESLSLSIYHKLKAIRIGSPIISDVLQSDMISVCEQNAHRLLCISTWDVNLTITI